MQPKFNVSREKTNQLTLQSYKNDFCSFQFHSQIEIYVVTEGEVEVLLDEKRQVLKAGEFSVALSYVGHQYKTVGDSPSSSFSIIIPQNYCEEFMMFTKNKELLNPFFDEKDLYNHIKICSQTMRSKYCHILKQRGLINVILGLILENGDFINSTSRTHSELIYKILDFLNKNFKNDISPSSIAEHFGYSPGYISRYFKSCFGITLVRYISMLRLRNALLLMNDNQYDVSYCAFESGFSSIRTFYSSFQKEYGCSPKSYSDRIKRW